MIGAVLFDLDGTLVDTAPDLGYALNLQRGVHGLPPLPDEIIRPQASHGTRGLLMLGFGVSPEDSGFNPMRQEFLQLYADNLCRHSRLFDGMAGVLDELEARNLPWGVVTNKPARFTEPLLSMLDLAERDVEAARNAGMPCVIAHYGYLGETDQPDAWGAVGLIHQPQELINYLGS
jgi:phosphoglycolate phosphatase-like HAD superfamily hydrolase